MFWQLIRYKRVVITWLDNAWWNTWIMKNKKQISKGMNMEAKVSIHSSKVKYITSLLKNLIMNQSWSQIIAATDRLQIYACMMYVHPRHITNSHPFSIYVIILQVMMVPWRSQIFKSRMVRILPPQDSVIIINQKQWHT